MKNKVHLSTESRIHREVYVRFGGRLSKTCRSNTTRRRVPSLHALSNAVSLYIEKIKKNRKIKPNFNSFYDFVKKDYRKVLADKNVREKDFDVDGFLNVLEPYYKNGEYGYLLNSDKELDLLNKRFIVFELDVVKDNPILFPVVTIIIMETFINKMRRLQGIRKMILIKEA